MSATTEAAGRFIGFDYCQFWVGNAKQAATFYIARYGFSPLAYRGLETGEQDVVTHVVRQNDIILAFSSPLKPGNKIMGQHMEQHGDGVKDVAFTVDNCRAIYELAVSKGAKSVQPPHELKDDNGVVVLASVQTYGDTIHTFVERSNYKGPFLPGFRLLSQEEIDSEPLTKVTAPINLLKIDHIVGNQNWDEMVPACEWYEEKLGFHRFWSVDDKQIHTEFSALKSIVMTDRDEKIKMPINEPAKGKKKSQIEEYVEFYGGSGVQHIALSTEDIISSVQLMKARGVEFLTIPDAYYEQLKKRLEHTDINIKEDLSIIQKLHILVDFDEKGYLLQIFTKPVEDRPTLFYEIIQRANNSGFGAGNFRALFQAIEIEQARRGTLTDTAN